MKVKRKNILFFLIVIFFLLNTRFLYLMKMPSIFGGAVSNVFLSGVGAICIFMIYLLLYNFHIYLGNFGILIFTFFTTLLFNIVSMYYHYHYSLSAFIWSSSSYFILLIYFPIKKYILTDNGWDNFIKLYEVICISLCTLLIAQQIVYNNSKTIFLDINNDYIVRFQYVTNGDSFLVYYIDGILRIAPILTGYKIIDSNYKIKNNIIHWTTFVLSIYAIVFIGRTRAYILSVIAGLICIVFLHKKFKWSIRKFFIVLLALIFFSVVIYTNIDSILVTLNNPKDGSNYARIGAIKYYLKHFSDHPFTGYGFVMPEKSSQFYLDIKGSLGIYNFDDIGLVGIIGSMGLLGSGWYVFCWVKMLLLSLNNKFKPLCLGLTAMMLVCMISLSYLDRARIIDLVLTMVVIDGTYECSRRRYVFYNYY